MTDNTQSLRAQILICTLGRKGLDRVAAGSWPAVEGFQYAVSVQDPDGRLSDADLEPLRSRGMIARIIRQPGISRNRNHAFDMASAPVVFLADDDLEYDASALRRAIDEIDARPDADIFCFRHEGPGNKPYPPAECSLATGFKGYWYTSFELAFRREALVRHRLRYSPLISFGAPYLTACDEELFMANCINRGLRGVFIPLTIVRHPDLTSGLKRTADPGFIRSQAAVCRVRNGWFGGLLRCPLIAHRSPAPTVKALLWTLQGYCYSLRHRKSLESL